jgi:poly(3-hydroxybutyrate) depolymerase
VPGSTTLTITAGGTTRTLIVHVPPSASSPMPLVLFSGRFSLIHFTLFE